MDEKKSVLTNNKAIENLEQDFQFANGAIENTGHASSKQYNRDILLQLRLHPLSLQKPQELPEMEVIKNKLYLNDITDMTSNSSEKHTNTSNCHPSVKHDYSNVKSEYPSLSPYFNRVYPYSYSSHAYNGTYQNLLLKRRSSFNAYCNSLKKHCIPSHQCLKDFSVEECLWGKQFASSEDMWNCYSNHLHTGTCKKKEHLEAVPKCKKKLSIIDPVTGKNVLDTIQPSQPEQNVSSGKENSKSVENHITTKQFCGDYFCNAKESQEASAYNSSEACYDSVSFSAGDKTSVDWKVPTTQFQVDVNVKPIENNSEEIDNYISSIIDNNKGAESEDQKDANVESPEVKSYVPDCTKTSEEAYKFETSKYHKKEPKISPVREMDSHMDVHCTCRAHAIKECHMHVCSENILKQNGTMQESLRQLKEKIYSLQQEEQKIAILQSFLRYKKYQLEESARNLDEKRIEIANWEYNLHNKAKKLQEKEQWLENKNEILNNKAQQLAEKEKMLNEEEKKFSDNAFYSNAFKETEVPEKKFALENNTSWNEISKIKNPRIDENNEYSFNRYNSKPAKISEGISSNIEKCKSDAFSLDELEKNFAFIEKLHSSSKVNDNTVDKIDVASSSNTFQKNDENASYDALGYSKGRRYLPEHIKYWLDKRDKNAL